MRTLKGVRIPRTQRIIFRVGTVVLTEQTDDPFLTSPMCVVSTCLWKYLQVFRRNNRTSSPCLKLLCTGYLGSNESTFYSKNYRYFGHCYIPGTSKYILGNACICSGGTVYMCMLFNLLLIRITTNKYERSKQQ